MRVSIIAHSSDKVKPYAPVPVYIAQCRALNLTLSERSMAQNDVRVAWEPLKAFTREVFIKAGLTPEDADIEAEVLVWANLRGVDSHGVLRIPWYVEYVETGDMNPRPKVQTLNETPATLFLDADRAFGPVVTTFAMNRAIEKAGRVGIGWCVIRNTTHQGAMGYYALMAARKDMAGIAIVCGPPNMAPFGAKAIGVHNSPISIAVPGKRHRPLILDMATSVVAGGKISVAQDRGVALPEGWALDENGNPTTDPDLADILLPSGGPKGSGLALLFECLSSLMAGNPLLIHGPQSVEERRFRYLQNSVVAAVDIATFTDVEGYKKTADTIIDHLKALPTADGHDRILVPGELEDAIYDNRVQNGIPLPPGTVRKLRETSEKLGVQLPRGL